MGGHPAISFAGDFLLFGGSNRYGSGIESIEFYPHIPSSQRNQSLEMLHARFDERVQELPKSWIKRKLRRIEISYNSELGTEEELVGEGQSEFSPSSFALACHEIVWHSTLSIAKLSRWTTYTGPRSNPILMDALNNFQNRHRIADHPATA